MISVVKMDSVPLTLQDDMQQFEKLFVYPLGKDGSFSISHGDDYGRFFRSIGKSRIYLAKKSSGVVGSLAVVERTISINGRHEKALYVGDLKIKPGASGKVLFCLMKEAYEDYAEYRDLPHYSVVMKGSTRPSDYTGRLGLPKFSKMGEVAVIRVPVKENLSSANCQCVDLNNVQSLAGSLRTEGVSLPMTRAIVRSKIAPVGLMLKNRSAACILEDTMEAKRLFESCGKEIITGHLSSFCYESRESALELVKTVLPKAHEAGFPAVFLSVSITDGEWLCRNLKGVHFAQANVFGRNMERVARWQINTSEI